MDFLQRVGTSLRLRLGRRFVSLRRASKGPRPASEAAAPSSRDSVPIIVAGCHRSGTSLVRRLLNSHSRIACPAEVQLFEALANVLAHESAKMGFSAIDLTIDSVAADLGALVERWMRTHAEKDGKRRWAEKSPGTFAVLPEVDQMLGGRAQFLLVVRDGRDVAASLGAGRWPVMGAHLAAHDDPYVAAAHYWVEATEKLLAFAQAVPGRTHVVRYDALVQDPVAVLQPMFAFLDEPWEPDVLDFNRFDHGGGFEDHVVSSTWKVEDGRGKHRRLPVAQQAAIAAVVGPLLPTILPPTIGLSNG